MNKIMKKYLFTAAAMMVAMTSCVKEADVVVPQDDNKVWVEFAAGVQTKVALNDGETNTVTWEKDDKVSINGVEFAVKNESISDDKTTATFGAYVEPSFLEAENFTAVYPVEAAEWVDGAPQITVPAVQDGAAGIIAVAEVAVLEDATLNFKHVVSFIKFQVTEDVETVTISADQAVAGKVKEVAFAEVESVTVVSYEAVEGQKTVTVSLGADAAFQPGTVYYAAVLPGEKTNFTLTFGDKVYKTWETLNIKQGRILNVKEKADRNLAYKLSDEVVTEVAYTMGTEFTAPVLTGEMTGVVYASSNAEVATVSETGKVTILAVGTTTITASAEENNTHLAGSASYTLTVAAAPKVARNLAFDPESVTVTYGETFTAPELTGETAGVVYTSTNPEVATVTPAGVVEILKAGTTTITASAEANDTHLAGSASYTLTVNKAARTLTFTESALEVTYGADVTEPTLNGVNDDETVVYTSSDETVATVDASGAVTVIKAGQTTITATVAATDTHETATAEYILTVKEKAVIRIKNLNGWSDLKITIKSGLTTIVDDIPMTNEGDNIFAYELDPKYVGQSVSYYLKHDWYQTSTKTVTLDADSKCTPIILNTTYLQPGNDWNTDNPTFGAWIWSDESDGVMVTATKVLDNFFEVEIPNDKTRNKILFLRCNPSSKTASFDTKWNATADLTLKHLCFCNNAWDNAGDGRWY